MTTNVMVVLPNPNHKRVKVTAYYVNTDGSLGDAYRSAELDHGQVTVAHDFCVHSTSKVLIEEID